MKNIISVVGPGSSATEQDIQNANELGFLIAKNDWVLISGARHSGIMHAVNEGAKKGNGLTIGILPNKNAEGLSPAVDVPIYTGMSSGRNYLIALSGQVIVACGLNSAGTLSEIALAMKEEKPIIVINGDQDLIVYLKKSYKKISFVSNASQAIQEIKKTLKVA